MPEGLFYPWIDITDEAWLRTAVLYWDAVRTIVPEAIDAPYSSRTGRALASEGFLVPLRVRSDMDEIEALTDTVMAYLRTAEGGEVLVTPSDGARHRLHPDKLPSRIRHLAELHPEKLPYEIRHILGRISSRGGAASEWLRVDDSFATFYMTLLASQLSERIGASLLTSFPAADRLALAARLDTRLNDIVPSVVRRAWQHPEEYAAFGRRRRLPSTLAQGLLGTLALERLGVAPDTPIKRLIAFRHKHAAELARFRSAIAAATESVGEDLSIEALRARVAAIYSDEIVPAMADLRAALTGNRIKWMSEGLLKVGFLSAAPSSLLIAGGLSVPMALLAGAGISVVASGMLYNREKVDALRANPYTYLLAAERELT